MYCTDRPNQTIHCTVVPYVALMLYELVCCPGAMRVLCVILVISNYFYCIKKKRKEKRESSKAEQENPQENMKSRNKRQTNASKTQLDWD